jgi:hypothetical protein
MYRHELALSETLVRGSNERTSVVEVTPLPTPNPNALKFQLDRQATDRRTETFRAGSDPADSPLGAAIFALGGVTNVFLAADFVSVTLDDAGQWETTLPRVVATIEEHYGQ